MYIACPKNSGFQRDYGGHLIHEFIIVSCYYFQIFIVVPSYVCFHLALVQLPTSQLQSENIKWKITEIMHMFKKNTLSDAGNLHL